MSRISHSNMAAPAVAVITEPIRPPAEIPSRLNTKPPIKAPIIPMMILLTRPEPPPFMRVPASQPAMAPMAKKMMISIIVLIVSVDERYLFDSTSSQFF